MIIYTNKGISRIYFLLLKIENISGNKLIYVVFEIISDNVCKKMNGTVIMYMYMNSNKFLIMFFNRADSIKLCKKNIDEILILRCMYKKMFECRITPGLAKSKFRVPYASGS